MKSKSPSQGSSLAIVLAFLAIFVMMSTTIARLLQTQMIFSSYHAARARTLTIAESGLSDALQILVDTPSWSAGYSNKVFEEGFYTVTVDTLTSASKISVVSEGKIPAGIAYTKEVRRRVWADLILFDKVCSSTSQDMDIDNTSSCVGNVYSGRDIDLSGSIVGDAGADRNITISGGGSVSGKKNSANFPPKPASIVFPGFRSDAGYKNQAMAGGTYTGDYTLDGVTATLGPLYITGKLKIKNSAVVTLTGTVFVKKEITIDESQLKGKRTLYTQDKLDIKKSTTGAGDLGPLMISEKDVKIDESAVYRSIVYSTNNGLTVQKSSVTGMVIGKDLDIKDNSTVTWIPITDLDVKLVGSAVAWNWGSN